MQSVTRMNLGIPTQSHKDAEIGLGLNQKQSLLGIHGRRPQTDAFRRDQPSGRRLGSVFKLCN